MPSGNHQVSLYFDAEGRFFQEVDGRRVQLHPWIGVQLEVFNEIPRDWKRENVAEYEGPMDVMRWLKEQESVQ